MSSRVKILTKEELAIARQNAIPAVDHVIDLLLRSGPRGIVEFLTVIRKECEKEKTSTSHSSQYEHINPEGLKDVFKQCGVLLSAEEYHTLFVAYGDPVGFVMLDPLLADVNPSINLRAAQVRTLRGVFPAAVSVSESPDGTTVEKLPPVTLNSVLDLLSSLLAPSAEDTEGVTENNCSAALQSVYEEAAVIFTMENYPQEQVPALDVLSFLAAFLSLLPNQTGGPDAVKMILQRLQSSAPLVQASTAAKGANQPGATAGLSCMTHTGVRTERKFDTYRTNDRRDEWLRGRDEQDARPQYQKHVVGYGGHLPEYRYHFGRTFHVIEEDLPALTKPKEQKEAIPPDAFGKPIELKYSRQSEHHHKFA